MMTIRRQPSRHCKHKARWILFSVINEKPNVPKGGIEDSDVVIEEFERVTINRGPSGHSKPPCRWLGSLSRDVRWYGSTREEEN